MRTKAAVIVGLGVGYVLGAKAGQERYRQIVAQTKNTRNNRKVQDTVETVIDKAADAVGKTNPGMADKAKQAATKITGAAHRSAPDTPPG